MSCQRCGAPSHLVPRRRRAARVAASLLGIGAAIFAALALFVLRGLPDPGLEAWLPSRGPALLTAVLVVSSLLQGFGAWQLFSRTGRDRCPACGDRREGP